MNPGQAVGLFLIKTALEEESSRIESYKHVPQSQADQTSRINELFQGVQHQDPMPPEPHRDVIKTSESGAFDQEIPVNESVDRNRSGGKKPQVGYDSMGPSPKETWDEHDAFRPWSSTIIDGSPGPAV